MKASTRLRKLLRRYGLRTLVATVWLGSIAYLYFLLDRIGATPASVLVTLVAFLSTSWHGAILYVLIQTLRPLTLFPTSILIALAGAVFGLWYGFLLTIIGATFAAGMSYWIGRFFSYPQHPNEAELAELSTWRRLLRSRTFEASIFLHLSFLPFDAVNYFAGIMRVRFFHFVAGTCIGNIPGALSFVSIGASIDINTLLTDGLSARVIDPRYLTLSVAVFLITLTISKFVHHRYTTAS